MFGLLFASEVLGASGGRLSDLDCGDSVDELAGIRSAFHEHKVVGHQRKTLTARLLKEWFEHIHSRRTGLIMDRLFMIGETTWRSPTHPTL